MSSRLYVHGSTQLIIQISQTFQKLLSLRGIEKLKKVPIKSFKGARRGNVTYGFSSSISNLGPLLENKTTVECFIHKKSGPI